MIQQGMRCRVETQITDTVMKGNRVAADLDLLGEIARLFR